VLRLYCAPWSTNVERVALALGHKGLSVERVWIDYADRAPVIAVSGQPLVPVLEHDGEVVSDSLRILRYLEQRWPEPPLIPADPVQAARVAVFLEWFDGVWKGPPNAIAAELERAAGADPAAVAIASRRLRGWLGVFEDLLGGGEFLFGGFGAADCAAHPFLKYAAGRPKDDDELFHRVLERELASDGSHPRLRAWIERVGAMPRA
jgi:glutathione S-transferase